MGSTNTSNDVVADKPQQDLDLNSLQAELGDGPMRFAPHGERTLQEQLDTLTDEERKCIETLKQKWHTNHPDQPFSDEMYLRFARCSPGIKKFNAKASEKVMKKFNRRYITLTASSLEDQLLSKVRQLWSVFVVYCLLVGIGCRLFPIFSLFINKPHSYNTYYDALNILV
jgi:hypothetical protein